MIDWTVAPRVLIVDDCPEQVRFLARVLKAEGCECETVTDGGRAFDTAIALAPDAILLDVELPTVDGLSICRRLKSTPETALIPVIVMTGQIGGEHHLHALEAGADDFLPKPTPAAVLRARMRSAIKWKRSIDGLDDAAGSIVMLATAIEARDATTKGHCDRLADYSVRLGERLSLDAQDLHTLRLGGYLHDLGKVAVPDAILFKHGRLTPAEFEFIKSHPVVGDRICAPLRTLQRVRPIVLCHHETIDGRGYPDGLSGSAVPLLAQIVSIADVYDALTSDRPYRAALSSERAFEELRAEVTAGRRDAALVDEFIGMQAPDAASSGRPASPIAPRSTRVAANA
jgi:putative two-component system response regulator